MFVKFVCFDEKAAALKEIYINPAHIQMFEPWKIKATMSETGLQQEKILTKISFKNGKSVIAFCDMKMVAYRLEKAEKGEKE